jgi:hypothetical protein
MNARVVMSLATMVAVLAAGCGSELSAASQDACSKGKASAARVQEAVDKGSPDGVIAVAHSEAEQVTLLSTLVDDKDVESSLKDMSNTFSDLAPDMSIDEIKAGVRDRTDKLNDACS